MPPSESRPRVARAVVEKELSTPGRARDDSVAGAGDPVTRVTMCSPPVPTPVDRWPVLPPDSPVEAAVVEAAPFTEEGVPPPVVVATKVDGPVPLLVPPVEAPPLAAVPEPVPAPVPVPVPVPPP